MQLTTTLKRFASAIAVLALGVGVLGFGSASSAQAATTTHLTGTVIFNNITSEGGAGAQIYVYYAHNGQWVSLGHITNANSSGNYSMDVTPGYEYLVEGVLTENDCAASGGSIDTFYGYSAPFVPQAATANAKVHLTGVIPTAC
jgi:hypothetical protein